jgi:homoserine O-succinyltransferase
VSSEALEDAGYAIIIHSELAGWTVASREVDRRAMVLVQGHPEYDPSSLLREYRRDAGRYVRGERSEEPILPFHCVSPEDWETLKRFHHETVLENRDTASFDEFAFEEMGARALWLWRSLATRFFTNWVSSVVPEED